MIESLMMPVPLWAAIAFYICGAGAIWSLSNQER